MLYVCFQFISLLTPFHVHDPRSQAPITSCFMAGNCLDCVVLASCLKTGSIKLFSHPSFKRHGMCVTLIVDVSGSQVRVRVVLRTITIRFYLFRFFFFFFLHHLLCLFFLGSLKRNLMERSLLQRRRSTIWSQSTLKCGWWTLTWKTWWCCPER